MGISGGPNVIRDSSLILDLDASDQNSYTSGSTTWNDLSGNGNNGTLNSTPLYSSTYNNGITFLSGGTYASTNLTIPSPSTRATTYEIAFIPATGSIVPFSGLMGYSGYQSDGFSLNIYSGGIINQAYSGSVSIFESAYSPISYTKVNVITAVFENRKNTYYYNGSFVNSTTYTFDILPSAIPIRIGGYTQGGWSQSQCTVFCARVYNRALSATEIKQNYNALKSRFNLT